MNKVPQRFTRRQFKHKIISYSLYQKWKKENPDWKHKTYQDFYRAINEVVEYIYDELSENPYGFRLPYYLGDLSIQSYVTKSNKNIAECLKQERFVPLLNLHTNRRPYKIIWSINYARKFNKSLKLMVFRPTSKARAKISNKIIEEHNKYKLAKPMFTLRNLDKIKV